MTKIAVNKTQKGGNKKIKSMMDKERAETLGLKNGGRIEYKYGGGVGCAKRGFNKKVLKKGKK